MFYPSFSAWINSFLACMGVCLDNVANLARYLSVCYPSGDMHCHGQLPFDSSSVSDGSRAYDIDTRRSCSPSSSSLSQSLLQHHHRYGHTSAVNGDGSQFFNAGLAHWNQIHTQWTDVKKSVNTTTYSMRSPDHRIGISATYSSLLGNNKPFRQPIPLSEMVEFLVDVWIEEGLYG